MLICVSPNPALDRRLRLGELGRGRVNRALSARPLAGGKAAHVAMAARALGEEAMWVGFLGGGAGDEVERGLAELGIPAMVVRTNTGTRSNLEVVELDGTVTEILEPGGEVTAGELERFFSMCSDVFAEWGADAQVALSGSLPPGAPVDLYAKLTRIARASGCRVLLDASGEPLRRGLEAAPDLVKPNREEAGWLTGSDLHDEHAAAGAALRLFAAGARSVAITLGERGLFFQRDAFSASITILPPAVEARSTVGCGDATLAGLAAARRRGLSDEETVALAVACGAANCLAAAPGMIDPAEVRRLHGLMRADGSRAWREPEHAEGGR
jgi:1-phosphofructokinase family hexose kinase